MFTHRPGVVALLLNRGSARWSASKPVPKYDAPNGWYVELEDGFGATWTCGHWRESSVSADAADLTEPIEGPDFERWKLRDLL